MPADGGRGVHPAPAPLCGRPDTRAQREKAREIPEPAYITHGAFDGDRVVGFAMLTKALRDGRMIPDSFHVSEEYRHRGIGRRLFAAAKAEAHR